MKTNDHDVFALGDCTEVMGRNRPFVLPLTLGAKALAKTLAGLPTEIHYPVMPIIVKAPAYPVIGVVDDVNRGNWSTTGENENLICRQINERGHLIGFVLCGDAVKMKEQLIAELNTSICETAS